jgi:hypothetical protein
VIKNCKVLNKHVLSAFYRPSHVGYSLFVCICTKCNFSYALSSDVCRCNYCVQFFSQFIMVQSILRLFVFFFHFLFLYFFCLLFLLFISFYHFSVLIFSMIHYIHSFPTCWQPFCNSYLFLISCLHKGFEPSILVAIL